MSDIRAGFSRVAARYDGYASPQKEIGRDLLASLDRGIESPALILDVGMGTGWLTEIISGLYPHSRVVGVDFAEGMVNVASKRHGRSFFVAGDAMRLPFRSASFDLIISNLAYQWVDDHKLAFAEILRLLIKGGRFYFTCFGRGSLKELRESFKQAFDKRGIRQPPQDNKLIDKEHVYRTLLSAGLGDVKASSYVRTELYDDIFSLVRWLKGIGANRLGRPFFAGRQIWDEANRHYLASYRNNGKIFASFEVIQAQGARK